MTIQMPKLVQRPSPNYSQRNGARISKIIVHDMQGGYEGSVAWLCAPHSQVSAHLCMKADGTEWSQLVGLEAKAWHCCQYNSETIGIEGEGYAEKGFPDSWYDSMSLGVAWLLHRYALPLRWAQGGQGDGFASHADLGAAGGGHTDIGPCGGPAWHRLSDAVGKAYAALDGAPLPGWAIYGLPAFQDIFGPPSAAPTTSHNGAIRHDLTPPNTDWVQMALNALHVPEVPLTVDGSAGPLTQHVIARFQGQHSLYVDGIAGQETVAALKLLLAP
jgi:hypothetical protein